MEIHSSIDITNAFKIMGWCVNTSRPGKQCTVLAMAGDRVIAKARANEFREDLKKAGYGDGCCGFTMPVNRKFYAQEVKLVDEETGIALSGSPIHMPSSAQDEDDASPIVLIELNDLFAYLDRHDHVSGIQRVVVNVVRALAETSEIPVNNIRPICFDHSINGFREIPLESVLTLFADTEIDTNYRKFRPPEDACLYLLGQLPGVRSLSLTKQECTRAVVLMLGAMWPQQSYFLGLRKLLQDGARFLPMIYDLIPILMQNDYPSAEFKVFLRQLIFHSRHFLACSEHTKKDIAQYFHSMGMAIPDITVTRCAQLFEHKDAMDNAHLPVNKPYVLCVSSIEVRKNHITALHVWLRLLEEMGDDAPDLVCVGRIGWKIDPFFELLMARPDLQKKVHILSDVSDTMLAQLYANCLFTLFLSLYEGWGLPVGESLSFGKVCIASNSSSIPEVGGDLAIYVEPTDTDDIYAKVRRLIQDNKWRNSLELKIRKSFKPIRWDDMADTIMQAILHLAKQPPSYRLPPVLDAEYSFAAMLLADNKYVHSGQFKHFLEASAQPELTSKRLSIEHYLYAEAAFVDGDVYHLESWGCWGHINGNTIAFELPDEQQNYVIFLKLRISSHHLPCELVLSTVGRVNTVKHVDQEYILLRLESKDYQIGNTLSITLCLAGMATKTVPGEPRQIGVGFCRIAFVPADDLAQRMAVLENLTIRGLNSKPEDVWFSTEDQ